MTTRYNTLSRRFISALLVLTALVSPLGHSDRKLQLALAQSPSVASQTSQTVDNLRIRDIQGIGHLSPYIGTAVSAVPGIVTAKRTTSFYIQDPSPDADPRTSEGLLIFVGSAAAVAPLNVGDSVLVTGTVQEFRPGGSSGADNLTLTELAGAVTATVLSSQNPLPTPTVIGAGGRVPPTQVVENDASGVGGDVESPGVLFDPDQDALDFYESLEGMLVQVNDAVAVGPTTGFGETPVLPDNGAASSVRSPRGGVVLDAGDVNPERILLDDALIGSSLATGLPDMAVGDRAAGPITGTLDYGFGNYKLLVAQRFPVTPGGLQPEVAEPAEPGQLAVATMNVENLDLGDPESKFDGLANIVVNHLRAPDLIAVEEVQDNSGTVSDGVTDAAQTWAKLIAAIASAGGPAYQFQDIAPADGADGGEPGGNIRVGFLYRTDRGLAFVSRPGGTATTAVAPIAAADGVILSHSPGRIAPTHSAFSTSRKPLAGEFTFGGRRLFVIANHFVSKSGDQALFGRTQPPIRASEVKRGEQAAQVAGFVQALLALDPKANVIVLGDLNDFAFSNALSTLKSAGLTNLMDGLPASERYTYVFEGNSQALDHTLVSTALQSSSATVTGFDIVHVNSEFLPAERSSDHDPQVVRFTFKPMVPLGRSVYVPLVSHSDASPTPTPTPPAPGPTPPPLPTPLTPTPPSQPTPPLPTGGANVVCTAISNGELCAWVSNGSPTRNSTVTVYGRLYVGGAPQSGRGMNAVWHYRTTTPSCSGVTDGSGTAGCSRSISTATAGFEVNIDVTIDGYSARTWFTPR